MADFCHDYDPGGLGCASEPCPKSCCGDFTAAVAEHAKTLKPGYEVQLGICEGHGSLVYLVRDSDGALQFEHLAPLGSTDEDTPPAHPPVTVVI